MRTNHSNFYAPETPPCSFVEDYHDFDEMKAIKVKVCITVDDCITVDSKSIDIMNLCYESEKHI